jgi:hypothetical protein
MNLAPELQAVAARLATQDNRCTAEPMFCVQEKRREYGYDPRWTDNTVWLLDREEVESDTPEADETGYQDKWHTVMVAFTEGGCEEYLRVNGHHHGETRIYVESFYRCAEMIAIRAWLMSLEAEAKINPEAESVIDSYRREAAESRERTIEDARAIIRKVEDLP